MVDVVGEGSPVVAVDGGAAPGHNTSAEVKQGALAKFVTWLVPVVTGCLQGFTTFGMIMVGTVFLGVSLAGPGIAWAIGLATVNGLLNIVFYRRDTSRIGNWLGQGFKGRRLWAQLNKKPHNESDLQMSVTDGVGFALYALLAPISVPVCAVIEWRSGDAPLLRKYRHQIAGMMGLAELEIQLRWRHLSHHVCKEGHRITSQEAFKQAINEAYKNEYHGLEANPDGQDFYENDGGTFSDDKKKWLETYLKTLQKAKDPALLEKRKCLFDTVCCDNTLFNVLKVPSHSVKARHGVSLFFLMLSMALSTGMMFLTLKGVASAFAVSSALKAVMLTGAGALTATGIGVVIPLVVISFIAMAAQLYVTLNEFFVDAYQPGKNFKEARENSWERFKLYMLGDNHKEKICKKTLFKRLLTFAFVGALIGLAIVCTIGLWKSYQSGLTKVFGSENPVLKSIPKLLSAMVAVINVALVSRLLMAVIMIARAGLVLAGGMAFVLWSVAQFAQLAYFKVKGEEEPAATIQKTMSNYWQNRRDIYKVLMFLPLMALNALANTVYPAKVAGVHEDGMAAAAWWVSFGLMARNAGLGFMRKKTDALLAILGNNSVFTDAQLTRFFEHRNKVLAGGETLFGKGSEYNQPDLAQRAFYLCKIVDEEPQNEASCDTDVMRLSEGAIINFNHLKALVPGANVAPQDTQKAGLKRKSENFKLILAHLKGHLMGYDNAAVFNDPELVGKEKSFGVWQRLGFALYLLLLPLSLPLCWSLEGSVSSLRKYRIQLAQFFYTDVDAMVAKTFVAQVGKVTDAQQKVAAIKAWCDYKKGDHNLRWSRKDLMKWLPYQQRADLLCQLGAFGDNAGGVGEIDQLISDLSNEQYKSYAHFKYAHSQAPGESRQQLFKDILVRHDKKRSFTSKSKGFFLQLWHMGFIRWLYAAAGVGGAVWWLWPFMSQAVAPLFGVVGAAGELGAVVTAAWLASPVLPIVFLAVSLLLVVGASYLLWSNLQKKHLNGKNNAGKLGKSPWKWALGGLTLLGTGGATWFCFAIVSAVFGVFNPVVAVAAVGIVMLAVASVLILRAKSVDRKVPGVNSWDSYWQGSWFESLFNLNFFSKVIGPAGAFWFLWSGLQVVVPSLSVGSAGLAAAGVGVAVTLNWVAVGITVAVIVWAAVRFGYKCYKESKVHANAQVNDGLNEKVKEQATDLNTYYQQCNQALETAIARPSVNSSAQTILVGLKEGLGGYHDQNPTGSLSEHRGFRKGSTHQQRRVALDDMLDALKKDSAVLTVEYVVGTINTARAGIQKAHKQTSSCRLFGTESALVRALDHVTGLSESQAVSQG